MPKLTQKTYFQDTKYISNSKITDWLKDKKFFYDKHVARTIEQEYTIPLITGHAVDMWITQGEMAFRKAYRVVTTRKKAEGDYRWQLNETMYNEIVAIVASLKRQDAFKELKGCCTQEILQMDMKLGKFKGIKGIPDWYKVDGDRCTIIDLKTSNTADTVKYFYHCLDYAYFRQFAMYTILLENKYPQIKSFEYRHLVVEKDPDNIYNVYPFRLANERVEMEKNNILEFILPAIAKEKDFAPRNCTWSDSIEIGGVSEEF